jgi:hypothetical protein
VHKGWGAQEYKSHILVFLVVFAQDRKRLIYVQIKILELVCWGLVLVTLRRNAMLCEEMACVVSLGSHVITNERDLGIKHNNQTSVIFTIFLTFF